MTQGEDARFSAPTPEPRRTFWQRLALVLALALVARGLVVAAVLPDVERAAAATDAGQFLILGRNLAEHGAFSQEREPPYTPDPIRTPGYPALVALLTFIGGPRPLAAILVAQALLGTLTVGGVALAGRRLLGPAEGLVGGLLAALAPATLILTGFASAEVLFSAWLVGGVLLVAEGLARSRWVLSGLGGLCFGAAALTRPIGVMLLPVLVIAPFLHGERERLAARMRGAWPHALAAALGLALLAGLWVGRNAAHFGAFSMSAIEDVNLYYYNAASLEAHRQGIPIDEARARLDERLEAMPPGESRWPGAQMGALARELIAAHPLAFAWYNGVDALNGLRPGFSYMLLLFGDTATIDNPIRIFRSGDIAASLRALPTGSLPLLALAAYLVAATAALIGLALAGVVVLAVRRRWLALVLAGLTPAILLYLPGVASNARFRAPAEPFLALLAAAAIVAVARRARGRLAVGG